MLFYVACWWHALVFFARALNTLKPYGTSCFTTVAADIHLFACAQKRMGELGRLVSSELDTKRLLGIKSNMKTVRDNERIQCGVEPLHMRLAWTCMHACAL